MFPEAALLVWSALALVWWIVSVALVPDIENGPDNEIKSSQEGAPRRSISIFKPLPPLGNASFDPRGLETFIAQMDSDTELLLGLHERDLAKFERWLASMREHFPEARLRVLWRAEADMKGNPKVAGLKLLAPHATGDLWLWSDADIAVPPGFLDAARAEYAKSGARMLTWPYIIGEIESPPAVLDALYVNAEFLPGVLLLRKQGAVDFGLGAAMLFSRSDFEERVRWRELSQALADDFVLGQRLQPVRVARDILTTAADESTWRSAILHYLRWSKTVRWNRPGGAAARIIVLPILGWLGFIGIRPENAFGWLGLAGMIVLDAGAAALICRRVGCRLRLRDLPGLVLWSPGRALAWLACWLPWPVVWRGQAWHGPFDKT